MPNTSERFIEPCIRQIRLNAKDHRPQYCVRLKNSAGRRIRIYSRSLETAIAARDLALHMRDVEGCLINAADVKRAL
jgi:hypothetical protein